MSPRGTRLCHALYGFVLIGSLTAVVATGTPRAETCAQPASLLLGALIAQPGTGATVPGRPPGSGVSAAVPVLRVVPVQPPVGADPYPPGTAIFGQEITFPPGGGATKIWLEIKLSGWGAVGLRGYQIPIKRVAAPGCPYPPCPCKTAPFEPSCPKDGNCPVGECIGDKCVAAAQDPDRHDHVFAGMPFSSDVEFHDPRVFKFSARLDEHARPKFDIGESNYGGSLVYFSLDWCPELTEFEIGPDPETPTTFELGDKTTTNPMLVSAKIRMMAAPPDKCLPGNDWVYVAVLVGIGLGLAIYAGVRWLLRTPKGPRSRPTDIG